jgi:F-type H+-transporting ATPase subunit delta
VAETATVARPYAEAAFELADKSGALADWSMALSNLALAAGNPQVHSLLGNPRVTAAQLVDMLVSSAGSVSAEVKNFVAALAENKRLEALSEIQQQFEQLRAEREGTVDARIETAFALDDAALAGLVSDLERRFKRKVKPEVVVNGELIGGARVTVGDQVIDGSVRGKLEAMSAGLASA